MHSVSDIHILLLTNSIGESCTAVTLKTKINQHRDSSSGSIHPSKERVHGSRYINHAGEEEDGDSRAITSRTDSYSPLIVYMIRY